MALAQILKKHLKNNGDERDDFLGNILLAFADNDKNERNNNQYFILKIP